LFFFICDFALALLYLMNWEAHEPFHKINQLLDLDGEANLPSWYSSMQLFLTACLLAVFTYCRFDKKEKNSWILIAWPLVFVFLSFDETAKIHEWLGGKSDVLLPGGTRAHTLFWSTGIWMFLLGIPFLLFMLGLIYSLKIYLRGRSQVIFKLFAGLLIFIGAAAGIEMAANLFPKESAGHVIEIFCEELGEMIGETFFLWASYELLGSCGFSLMDLRLEQ
jgi:hypothetical protein